VFARRASFKVFTTSTKTRIFVAYFSFDNNVGQINSLNQPCLVLGGAYRKVLQIFIITIRKIIIGIIGIQNTEKVFNFK